VNAALIGSIVGTTLIVVAIVLLSVIILCLVCCRYRRTAKMSIKKTDQ
jgi:heme/copper-type cytochrome/quinol oxidase subunit 2